MKPAAARLLVTGALFLGWMAYLAYQVATLPRAAPASPASTLLALGEEPPPLVLSRPQILTSRLDVIGEVPEGRGEVEVTVVQVLSPEKGAPVQEGDTIVVTNVEDCRLPVHRQERVAWTGPGRYLLPLRKAEGAPGKGKGKEGKPRYEVAPVPPSPGYSPPVPADFFPPAGTLPAGPPRIYPANREGEVLAQYRKIPKPKPVEGGG
jgi:hypothetical protein